jgi:hypothetical protein
MSMATSREERLAELEGLWRTENGKRTVRKLYLELTGQPVPSVVYLPSFFSEILNLEAERNTSGHTMEVLLTWSGRASHEIAIYLREWLPEVIPGIAPWVSSEDIAKGKRWTTELHSQLDKTRVSITIITSENVKSPWFFSRLDI